MRLPEPARTTFLAGWEAVESAANQIGISTEEIRLGGGTLLATRWNHRKSIDIDLTVDPEIHLAVLYRELARGPLPDQGWTIEYSRALDKLLVSEPPSLQTTPYGDERGRFDIWSKAPNPEHGAGTDTIEDLKFSTLSNVQVLTGKLDRATRALPRDVADFAVGGEKDPLSVEYAINQWVPERAGTVANAWMKAIREWGTDEWKELETILNVSSREAREIAGRGPDVLRAAVYKNVRIEKGHDDEVHVRTSSGLCDNRNLRFTVSELEEFLKTSGFATRMRRATTERVLAAARRAPAGESIYAEENGDETVTRPAPLPAAKRPANTSRRTDRHRRNRDERLTMSIDQ